MRLDLTPGMRLHIIGIGGAGMSAIARVLLGRGFQVSGSDQQGNAKTEALATAGATIHIGHSAEFVEGADAVVVSSAVPPTNPEWVAALSRDLPVLKRADLLGELMQGTFGIAVAGTHGKTTTTGMIAHILIECGLDPTVILGGTLAELGGNGRFGQGPHFVIEADEYDHMFLGLRPQVAVITNVEHDHPDLFPTAADYRVAFAHFAALLPMDGRLIICADDPGAAELMATLQPAGAPVITYGLEESGGKQLDVRALDVRPNQMGGSDFVVEMAGQSVGLARIRLPGLHNVRNALAALVVALELSIDFVPACRALAGFGGVQRRFQLIGEAGGVTVIDDYAHHPTEIRATLAAARQRYPGRRLWAVWQPHTYSRTRLLSAAFAASFAQADRVVALDIYGSRELADPGVTTAGVVALMDHPHAIHVADRRDAADYLLERLHPDDVVLTLGAGDGDVIGRWVLEGLQEQLGSKRKSAT
ncbi:MAG: UDP-N-acetylmuramate--L-alanine ligase [Candidatus Promineofilum sp.]|nr:UDP-N-acetylmuramate--L-alanine ligase [Promineifilum sp.]